MSEVNYSDILIQVKDSFVWNNLQNKLKDMLEIFSLIRTSNYANLTLDEIYETIETEDWYQSGFDDLYLTNKDEDAGLCELSGRFDYVFNYTNFTFNNNKFHIISYNKECFSTFETLPLYFAENGESADILIICPKVESNDDLITIYGTLHEISHAVKLGFIPEEVYDDQELEEILTDTMALLAFRDMLVLDLDSLYSQMLAEQDDPDYINNYMTYINRLVGDLYKDEILTKDSIQEYNITSFH